MYTRITKVCTKLLALLDNTKKTQFGSLSRKKKIAPCPRLPPPFISSTYRQDSLHNYGFLPGSLRFQSTGQNNLTSKRAIWLCWLQKKTWTKSNQNCSFRKLNSYLTKTGMLFSIHLQGRELCPQTYSLYIASTMESSYTHFCWHNNGQGIQAWKVSFLHTTTVTHCSSMITKPHQAFVSRMSSGKVSRESPKRPASVRPTERGYTEETVGRGEPHPSKGLWNCAQHGDC